MFNTRLWVFLNNMFIAYKHGKRPKAKEMWKLAGVGLKFNDLTFQMAAVAHQIPPIIRKVIDAVGATPTTSGTLGLGYQLALGRRSENASTDTACARIFAEIRYFRIRSDALAMMLLEGIIPIETYISLLKECREHDEAFKEKLLAKYPTLLKEGSAGPYLEEAANRILRGESRELVQHEYLVRIFPSLKQSGALEA